MTVLDFKISCGKNLLPTITSIREENSYIKIEWTPSKKGTNKILGYAIYRSINGSPYEKIGEVDYNTNFYIDQNVQPNNLYQYYVKAFDSEIPRVYSLPSNIKNAQKNEGRISLKKLIHNYEIKTVTKIVKCNDENKFLVGTDVGLFELYFDINDNPIFTSVFQGKVEDVLYSNKKILLLSSGEVFYKSIEDTEWKKLPLPIDNSKILKLDYKPDNNVIYIITGDMELYRTLNFGNTWDLISKLPLEGLNIFTFYVEKTDQNLMFIGTDVGLYKSKDGGENFYESDNGLENTWISSFINDPYNSKKYYLSTWGGKIYYSEDSGNTWNPLGNDFQNYTYEINLNFDYPWILYAATQKGLYYFNSVNGWTVASNELEDSWVKTIASSKDKIVIGTLDGEIYYFEKNKYIELCRPNNLSYEKIDTNTIKLTWNVESLENIAGFIIYIKTSGNQSFKPIKIVKADNRYSIIKVDNPQEIFTIKAFNSDILPTTSDFSPILEVELHETEDNSPPQLLVYIPEKTSNPELEISGKVIDRESGVKYLKINGVNVSVSSDGSFSYTITLNEGENTITFEAEDTRGNKTKKTFTVNYVKKIILKLQIGNRVMLVNDTQVEIDVPPAIVEGRTLLPIRWVAEPLGADVSWDGKERKVTVSLNDTTIELWIGKPLARVNGEYKLIDPNNPKVVPMIIKGRTMLPVRFVAENLGADVLWDGTTKTVTIIYPKE